MSILSRNILLLNSSQSKQLPLTTYSNSIYVNKNILSNFKEQRREIITEKEIDIPLEPVIETQYDDTKFTSNATQSEAKGRYLHLPITPKKQYILCRQVRGMNVREALIQLRQSEWKKSIFISQQLRTISHYAVSNYNMNKERLYIKQINALYGRRLKRLDIKARGRNGIRQRRYSHLYITLAEQPYHEHEIRIGRYGRTIESWRRVDSMLKSFRENQQQQEQ